jgi:hypothetical protein
MPRRASPAQTTATYAPFLIPTAVPYFPNGCRKAAVSAFKEQTTENKGISATVLFFVL